ILSKTKVGSRRRASASPLPQALEGAPRGVQSIRQRFCPPFGIRGMKRFHHRGAHHFARHVRAAPSRSEEHTSELQSLMRNSYAVFCLKKKTYRHSQTTN